MIINKKFDFSKKSLLEKGEIFFNYGILLLPSLLPISILLFLISLVISLSLNKINFKSDKWNQTLLLVTGIIIFNSLNVILFDPIVDNIDNYLIIFFNAFKWIVLYLSFAGFQHYLRTSSQRIKFISFLILGSLPVVLSCFLQYWFKIYGPFEFLNGLIIWYNKPIEASTDGVSGLFSNQNYTGFWLTIIWPFCVYFIKENRLFKIKKILLIIFGFSLIYLIFMTTSRASILGLIISMPIIFSFKLIMIFIFLILLLFLVSNISFSSLFISNNFVNQPIQILIDKFLTLNLYDIQNSLRIKIWSHTLNFIYSKPIIGFGAGLFPIIYLTLKEDYEAQHSHNIILQIAFDYGIVASIVLSSFVFILLFKSWLKIFINSKIHSRGENSIETFWFASALVAVISQLYDVTYFEGRVSILIWILLAGLKSITDNNLQTSKRFL